MSTESRFASFRGARGLAVPLLVGAVLLPYSSMLTGSALPIPDDIFASDLVEGEMAGRVEVARRAMAGESPFWTPSIVCGFPAGFDPLSLVLFAALPPAMALGWLVGYFLGVAALGTYGLARHLGASRAGAFLAGFAFAWSGFVVCQLRHLGVMGTVAYFPLALLCLERAAIGGAPTAAASWALPWHRRALWTAAFAGIYGLQWLGGFPQSNYIASLAYAAIVLARALWLTTAAAPGDAPGLLTRLRPSLVLGSLAAAAVVVGLMIGMAGLVPMHELGALSDRGEGVSYEWATRWSYWPRNVLTFFVPYVNGDISNRTYAHPQSIFWEDYGYVGLGTMVLAALALATSHRKFTVRFWAATTAVAFLMVLGRNTPLYEWAFHALPGLSRFRFPTRFLFVVELGLVLLGAVGLTTLEDWLGRALEKRGARTALAAAFSVVIAGGSAADLVATNARQNPLVSAERWLAPPHTVELIRATGEEGRVYTPEANAFHMRAFVAANGWSGSLEPYLRHRELIHPNANLLVGLDTLGGYTGIAPRWSVDLLGDHNRRGFVTQMTRLGERGVEAQPMLLDWLAALSVRWFVVPQRIRNPRLEHLGSAPPVEVYRLLDWMPRARIVDRARVFASHEQVFSEAAEERFDVRRELALHDPSLLPVAERTSRRASEGPAGQARMVVDESGVVAVETSTSREAWLYLADTFYPGWVADIDGREVPIVRANVAHRAVLVPAGRHRVTFRFDSPTFRLGWTLTGSGVAALLLGLLVALRARRHTQAAAAEVEPSAARAR